MHFLDPVTLARLRGIRLDRLRRRAAGEPGGKHRSVQHSFAQEFSQHRPYAPGDELKFLDWKVYARKERFFIKQSYEEQGLRAYLLVDASGSMRYKGSGLETKFERAASLAAAFAYLLLSQGDSAGLVTFDVKPSTFLPPRRHLGQLERIDAALASTAPRGETDLSATLRQVAARIPRRSLLILFSDLLGDADRILETVKAFRARKHEVLAVQVLDPLERDLDLEGPVRFEGLEDGERVLCEVGLLRAAYREAFDRQLRLYQSGFHQASIPYAPVFTDAPREQSLSRVLSAVRA